VQWAARRSKLSPNGDLASVGSVRIVGNPSKGALHGVGWIPILSVTADEIR
jgi:hypothetical protein